MRIIKKIYDGIGLVSEWVGRVAMWLVIVLIVIITYEVMMRYLFNAPTIWSFDLGYMFLATLAALGFAYVYYHRGNVRVDVIYIKFSPKTKLIVDIVFTIAFFFPLFFMLALVFVQNAWYAYSIKEIVAWGCWSPLTWPYKTMIALGFSLLFLQGIATFLKDVMALAKGGKEPW